MNTEGFELELKEYDSSVLIAEESFSAHNYAKSLVEYETALAQAKALFRPVSEQVVGCMLGLADCYFESDYLGEAKNKYEELLVTYSQIPEVEVAQTIAVLFKLAKIAEKRRDITAAETAYYRALKQAEANLQSVHRTFPSAKLMQRCFSERT